MVIALSLVFLVNGCNSTSGGGLGVGDAAPDFQLQGIEGQTITLGSLAGSPVMLNFWASWCGPCRYEMPFIQQIYEDWQNEGVILLSINLREAHSTATQFIKDNDLSFPVLLDTDGSVGQDYKVSGIPTTFFIDENGVIQARKLGPFTSVAEIENFLAKIIT